MKYLVFLLILFACGQDQDPLVFTQGFPGNYTLIEADSLNGNRLRIVSQNTTLQEQWTASEGVILQYIVDSLGLSTAVWYKSDGSTISPIALGDTLTISNQTLSISNDSLFISGGNGVSLADYVGGGTEITDSLNLSGTDPVVIFDDTSPAGRDFVIRSIPNAFELYDLTSGATRIYIDADGRVGFGSAAPSEAKMYLYGGASGANFDIRADDSNESSTLEVQSSDFATSFQSTWIQQSGPAVVGNAIDAIPNAGLGRLAFQMSDNALIYTISAAPLIFGTDFTERGRFTETGELVLLSSLEANDSIMLNGISIISGTTVPASGLGSQGSLYMRDDNDSTLYTKTAAGWVLLN